MLTAQDALSITLYANSSAPSILDDIDNNIQAFAEAGDWNIRYCTNVFITDDEIKNVTENLEQRGFKVWNKGGFLIIHWGRIKPV